MRRRMLALAGLTSVAVVSGSIAVADGPTADDLASSAALGEAAPTAVDVDEVVSRARTVREPLVAARQESLAALDAAPTPQRVEAVATPEPNAPAPQPEPTPEPPTTTTWVASWYGPGFHGNLTANGETFDQWAMTAAHKSLDFGTEVRVTNPSTGDSVVVRINDRGPFVGGRDIDLSRGAAQALGVSGVARVEVEIL